MKTLMQRQEELNKEEINQDENITKGRALLRYLQLNLKGEHSRRRLSIVKRLVVEYTQPNNYAATTNAKCLAVVVRMNQAR